MRCSGGALDTKGPPGLSKHLGGASAAPGVPSARPASGVRLPPEGASPACGRASGSQSSAGAPGPRPSPAGLARWRTHRPRVRVGVGRRRGWQLRARGMRDRPRAWEGDAGRPRPRLSGPAPARRPRPPRGRSEQVRCADPRAGLQPVQPFGAPAGTEELRELQPGDPTAQPGSAPSRWRSWVRDGRRGGS